MSAYKLVRLGHEEKKKREGKKTDKDEGQKNSDRGKTKKAENGKNPQHAVAVVFL